MELIDGAGGEIPHTVFGRPSHSRTSECPCCRTDGRPLQMPSGSHVYFWLTDLSGRVGVGPVTSSVYLSPSDVLNMLKFGATAYAEGRFGAWSLSADGMNASLGQEHVFAIRDDTGSLDLTQNLTIIQPMGGYTVMARDWGVEIVGGFRYWKLHALLDVDRFLRPSNEHSASRNWLDAIGGVRLRRIPLERMRFLLNADAGASGSRRTEQLFSSLGYDLWNEGTLALSYRTFSLDYGRNDFLYDTNQQGFVLGPTFRVR